VCASGASCIRRSLARSHPGSVIAELHSHRCVRQLTDAADVMSLLTAVTGMTQAESNARIVQRLLHRLLHSIHTANALQTRALLDASFSFISVEELRIVPVTLLQRLPSIPQRFLKRLTEERKLLMNLPLSLSRQVWLSAPDTAADAIDGHINAFLTKQHKHSRHQPDSSAASSSPLSSLIADSAALFQQAVDQIVAAFASSGDRCLAVLLMDIATQHQHDIDSNNSEAQQQPSVSQHTAPCLLLLDWCSLWHRFIAASAISPDVVSALMPRFDRLRASAPSSSSSALLCFWLVLCHPAIDTMLLSAIIACLHDVVEQERIPNDHLQLHLYSDLLHASIHAHRMVRSADSNRPTASAQLFHVLYPLLVELILLSLMDEKEDLNTKLSRAHHQHDP
jgi:Cofactor of BRCA1 (COBRA1)